MSQYDKNNVFYKIINKSIPSKVVYEDDIVLAINDINPASPVHILVMPKEEYVSFNDFIELANEEYIARFFKSIKAIVKLLQLEDSGYRLLMNHGSDAMQTVKHFHCHILGKKKLSHEDGHVGHQL